MHTKTIAAALVVALAVSACATPSTTSGTKGGGDACNPIVIAATAAIVCGALAKGNKRAKAALACGIAAAIGCAITNSYKVDQVRTAAALEEEYRRNSKPLPAQPTLTSETSELSPRGAVRRGQNMYVASTLVVAPGRSSSMVSVEEEISIVDSTGDVWGKPTRKVANPGGQAGEYRTSFTIPVSNEMSQGVYQVKRAIYINGARVKENPHSSFQVVESGVGQFQTAFLDK